MEKKRNRNLRTKKNKKVYEKKTLKKKPMKTTSKQTIYENTEGDKGRKNDREQNMER